ncbi:retron system putative HNH endonuclease [Pantoea agglomerans]|uniref:retron system putative HNH endonuclease n=1 Tax=Enterobacter agglomerans TaxID=549 RepID=UPI0009073F4E|nr:retron system putative HNH endonuclease [Pantoea agglomerans]
MRSIIKSNEKIVFSQYRISQPNSTWDEFKNFERGNVYKLIKNQIFDDQFQLCAYCETSVPKTPENERRIEHFRSKSGCDPKIDNWHLDWMNLLGVCVGGSNCKAEYELPLNLSCDSHKSYYEETHKRETKDWVGRILLPLSLPPEHELFMFDKKNGNLLPNKTYCDGFEFENHTNVNIEELVKKTIIVLNLNCERLCKARLVMLHEFNRSLANYRSTNNITVFRNLVIRWSKGTPSFFQTTRLMLLKDSFIAKKIMEGKD